MYDFSGLFFVKFGEGDFLFSLIWINTDYHDKQSQKPSGCNLPPYHRQAYLKDREASGISQSERITIRAQENIQELEFFSQNGKF